MNASPPLAASKERPFVFLLCFIAAVRVFIFSAAFPFFCNVDEQAHFDLVIKYSQGHVPRSMENVSTESARFIAVYSSSEFMGDTNKFPGGIFPPPLWTQPMEKIKEKLFANQSWWMQAKSYEASQPPFYYAVAAIWLHLGKLLGMDGGSLLYWLRFLNVLVISAAVWLGFRVAQLIFPEQRTLQLSVAALLAFLPQDAFYSIENDVLAPVCFGALFICLLKLLRMDVPTVRLGLLTGLAVAATFLTKISALPLLAIIAGAVLLKCWRLFKEQKIKAALPALLVLFFSAVVPIAGWLIRTKLAFGDWTGSKSKIAFLDWTQKPLADWFDHPIFTLPGIWIFLSDLLAAFWRGEFMWHREMVAVRAADLFYVISSLVLIALALVSLFPRFANDLKEDRHGLWLAFGCVVASILFLAMLSIMFDFGSCFNPSRAHPYFAAGRLMSGALIPFFVLYVHGLNWAFGKMKAEKLLPFAIAAVCLLAIISEVIVSRPAFASAYNWFHL